MIPVRNVYYMLSYAFQTLNAQGYQKMATEEFSNVAELCAAILCKGVSLLIKQGIGREYIEKTEPLSALRGRIDMAESIKTLSMIRQKLVCSYDDFSVNYPLNQIIKTTMELLVGGDIAKERKKELKRLLVYFQDVDSLDIHSINWQICYNRNNETYRMLVNICYLVIKGLIHTKSDGSTKLMDFLDEQRMCRLYEKFILEYYRKELPGLGYPDIAVSASQIPWVLGDNMSAMLPVMQSDIMLSHSNDVLIIDAKYYASNTQSQYNSRTLHSHNLYQIFTYVKNKDAGFGGKEHTVSGMLLYAKTDEQIQPDGDYQMSGNRISVKTLDLNRDFSEISEQLNGIVSVWIKSISGKV